MKGELNVSVNSFGIDLGTSNIKIYNLADDTILNQKNMIAIRNKKSLFAVGDEAFEMFEKAPGNIHISYPLNNGVIANINSMQILLKEFLKMSTNNSVRPADYYIAVPSDITEVERRAFGDLIKSAGLKPKKIYTVEKAIADAAGLGVNMNEATGIMVVNIGAETTEISVISLGGVVISRLIKAGGVKFDEAIQSSIRRNYNLMIGDKSAAVIKHQLASAIPEEDGLTGTVCGRDVVTGLPLEIAIPSKIVYEALKEPLHVIMDAIKVILERTPPEFARDIIKSGVYVTGGGAMVRNLPQFITESTGLPVNICENPSESVARGLANIMKNNDYRYLAYNIKDITGPGK